MKTKMKKTLSFFLVVVLIVPMFASIPAKKAEAADEVLPAGYTEYTFKELGFDDGTYEQSVTTYPAGINGNLENGVAISGYVKIENNSQSRICFGAGIDNNGIKLYGGTNELVIQNMLGDNFIYTFNSNTVGYSVTGTYVDLKLSFQKVDHDGDNEKDDLKLGVWFEDKLYNNTYIYRDNYPFIDNFAPTVSIHKQAPSPESENAAISISSTPLVVEEVIPDSYTEFTFAQLGFEDKVYTEYETHDTPQINQNIENGVVISGEVKFEKNTGSRICFGTAGDDNGFKLHPDYGENLVIQNMAPVGFFYHSFTEDSANVPVTGAYVDLKISLQKVNHDGNGGVNDLKMGVWFAGKLYNNQYIYFDNYSAIDPLIQNITINPQGASLAIRSPKVAEVLPEGLTEFTFTQLGFEEKVYTEYASVETPLINQNIANGVVISGQVKFEKNTRARISFGAGLDNNGFKLHPDGGENLVIQNNAPVGFFYHSFTEANAGVPVTGEYVDLKISLQKVNRDGGSVANDLKMGVWIARKLYNNQYIYFDNYSAIDPLIPVIEINPQGASVGIKNPLKGKDTKVVRYTDIAQYRQTVGNYTIPDNIPEGYVFAGWFEDDSCETAIAVDKRSGAAYAKFVDADLMDVKAQVTAGTTVFSEKTSMRLLSAVDSLEYSKVGFELTVGSYEPIVVGNKTVYKTLTVTLGDGNPYTKTPAETFVKTAEYFKACVIADIPKADFNTDIIVTPYWKTLDGTKVSGTPITKKVSQGIGFIEDTTRAYPFFGRTDRRSEWTVNSTTSYRDFNTYRVKESSLICNFVQEEKFSAAEYPYMAYRYKATTQKTQGLVYVASSEHSAYSDEGLTWIPLNNKGEWTNHIVNMAENNAYWKGTITSVRLDPVHMIFNDDPNSEVYIDRIGFFKTQKDAEAFLSVPNNIDYTDSFKSDAGFVQVMIPSGAAEKNDSVSQYMLADVSAATAKNGIMPLVGIKNGNTITPVPVSYVNAVGYINYMAEMKGEYVLYYPDKSPSNDDEFVSIRGIMTDTMIATERVTLETVWSALRNTLVNKGNGSDSQWADSLGMDTSNATKVATAKDIAKAIHAYLAYLDAEVFVNTEYVYASVISDAELVAVGSGIITDINDSTITGKELASIMSRIVMAILDQPVGESNIKENSIKIGGWTNMTWKVDDDAMKQVADCGINMLMSVGDLENDNVLRQVLQSGRRYGVELLRYNYYPNNFNMSNPASIPTTNYKYYDYDSYLGNHIFDEPGTDSFAMLGDLATYFRNQLPGKTAFYNLLPYYASPAQLKEGVNAPNYIQTNDHKALYKDYLQQYINKVPGDYICMDLYPLRMSSNKKDTYDNYLRNMDIFAQACRTSGRDFWLYIQSSSQIFGRTVDYNDIRWQMYTGLSFGVNTFIHFTYGSYDNNEALIGKDGKPTVAYTAAQKANKEIMALSDDYMQYKNVGAFNKNCSYSIFNKTYDYAQFDNQYTGFNILKNITSSDPLLFGCFEKKVGSGYAFSVVNMHEPGLNKSASLTFTLDGNHNVYAWMQGKKVSLTPNNGVYTLNLETAEGAFVVIE